MPRNMSPPRLLVIAVACVCLYALLGAADSQPNSQTDQPEGVDRYLMGVKAFKAGKNSQALSGFEHVASNSQGYLQLCAVNMVGQIHRLQNSPLKAKETFADLQGLARRLLESGSLQPEVARHATALELLALHYQLEIAEQQQSWEEAINFLQQLALAPDLEGLGWSAGLQERLARLHWRQGRYQEALAAFKQLLAKWPDTKTRPRVQMAVAYLESFSPSGRDSKLSFLSCPLNDVTVGTNDPELMSRLAVPQSPLQDCLDRTLKDRHADGLCRAALLMAKGWMLFESNRPADSMPAFAEAGNLAQADGSVSAIILQSYAELSQALICLQQDEYERASELVRGVLARDPQGHVMVLANSVNTSMTHRRDERRIDQRCGVQKLE